MKKLILLSLIMTSFSFAASACKINTKMIAKEKAPDASNIKMAMTDKLDDWMKVMGAYITYQSKKKSYAGYAKFDQNTCRLISFDVQELMSVD